MTVRTEEQGSLAALGMRRLWERAPQTKIPVSSRGQSPRDLQGHSDAAWSSIPLDLEGLALALDVAGVGAGEVGRAEKRAAFGAVLEEQPPALGRQILVPAELARPVRIIDLDRMMHDVAGEAGAPAAILQVDRDGTRRVAGIVLQG